VIGVLAVAGLADSAYLTIAHYSNAPLACANTGVINCDLVTRSSYGVIPGTAVPVSLAGIAWFAIALVLAAMLARSGSAPALALVGWSIAGTAAALYLVYVELVLLHHICEWCTVAHVAVVAILLLSVSAAQTRVGRLADA